MDDYWNDSQTAPSALDDFFDEESTVTWTGSSTEFTNRRNGRSQPNAQNIRQDDFVHVNTSSSVLDNISIHSDSGLAGIKSGRSKSVSKTIGEKIDALKVPAGVSLIWNKSESGSCLQCCSKDEEIIRLKDRLERTFTKYDITLPPEDTVNRIILGLPYSLESYKTHIDKIALLDAAISSGDSSVILIIILFLKKTLKKTIFQKELLKKSTAALVYVDYLKNRQEHIEAVNILKLLGKTEEAAMHMFSIAISSKDGEEKIRNLKTTVKDYFPSDSMNHEAKMIKNYIDLIEVQIPMDLQDSKDQKNQMLLKYPRASPISGQPLLTTLFYCCMYHWETSDTKTTAPLSIKKQFALTDCQFLWTVLRSRARVNYWPLPSELDSLLVPPGLFGKITNLSNIPGSRRTVKDTLPIDRVLHSLTSSNAPTNVVSAYIHLLPTTDEKLKSATLYKCHQAVIDIYILLKDKTSLEKYMREIPQGSPEFIKAENFLKTLR